MLALMDLSVFTGITPTLTIATMQFSVFVPGDVAEKPLPVLTYLAGLTCTEETFMSKGGAQCVAAELGIILVAPDNQSAWRCCS